MYAIYHGPEGLKNIANRVNYAAQVTSRIFEHYGFTLLSQENKLAYFDTITVIDCDAKRLKD
jgi:glycine cleavage system pyridoxal-binding protein P